MSMILGSLRGIYILTPRNMTQAAGMYNTMLASDDPALIIECLNGYRLREKLPSNLTDFKVSLGKIEVLKEESDVTVVTYGSNCRIAMDASSNLESLGISCEVIDVQSLIPFDLDQGILASISKTNKVVLLDLATNECRSLTLSIDSDMMEVETNADSMDIDEDMKDSQDSP